MKVAIIIPSTSKNRDWNNPIDSYLYTTINSIIDKTGNTSNDNIHIFIFLDKSII